MSQSYVTVTTTHSEIFTNYSPVATYTFTTASTQSYLTSFTLNANEYRTCYFTSIPFDAQSGDVVTGTEYPGPLGVVLEIMHSSAYNLFSHAQAETCLEFARYSEHIDSYIGPNNVLFFSWKAPATDHYYFVFLNAGGGNVMVVFAASKTGSIIVSSTEYQTQTIQLPQTLVLSSIYSTSYSSLQTPQSMNSQPPSNMTLLALVIATIAAIALTALLVYSRKVKQPKTKKLESETKKAASGKNFCIECGKELPPKSKFCKECGAKVSE